mmetsp:Transcript_8234/g.24687  ORF Transcript_8234/g.24687 Transcript_8234/m.24687 type:complete len:208 (-) Transcript_8234:24-647(-)
MASLRMLFSEDTLEEVGYSLRRLNPTFAGARPWKEFFACFKPPEHLEKRMSTNLLHYKANYCIIFVLVVALGLLSSPRAIFALGICAALAAACLLAEVRGRYIQVGSFKVPVTKSSRASAAAICSVVTLVVSGQVLWIAITFSTALLLPLLHMALRPRTLAAKYTNAREDVRALWSAQPTSDEKADSAEGGYSPGSEGSGLRARRPS